MVAKNSSKDTVREVQDSRRLSISWIQGNPQVVGNTDPRITEWLRDTFPFLPPEILFRTPNRKEKYENANLYHK